MKYLWPYRQTKTKAFFRDGKNKIIVERKSKYEFEVKGRTKKTLLWDVGETVNLEQVKLCSLNVAGLFYYLCCIGL